MAINNNLNNTLNSPTITGNSTFNSTTGGATTIGNSGDSGLTIAGNGNSTWAMNSKSFTLTTGTGNINIGTDATNKTINIGSTSTTQFVLTSGGMVIDSGASGAGTTYSFTKMGSGNLNISQTGTGTFDIADTTSTNIANSTVPTSIQFGNRATAVNGTIGNNTSTTSVKFDTGSGTINIGTTGAKPLTIGSSSNTIIFNTGTGGIIYPSIEVTGTSVALVIGICYTMNNGSQISASLPTTAAVGTCIRICGYGSGGWKITQSSGQIINSTAASTTSGATGSLSSGGRYDCVELVCTVVNTTWSIKDSIGTLAFA
jgi:hypothetical protein